MSKAQNYQGRSKETYPFQLKSDESIVCMHDDSHGDTVTESSSRVGEENDSYTLINSNSLLSNDDLFKMLSNDRRFIQSCKDHNITIDDRELLKNNFKQYIEKYTTFTQREIDFINEKKELLAEARRMAPDNSHLVQVATTGKAGAAAYLSSFMWGKLATNIVTTGTGSSHGVWPFLLIAGLLNPLASEPWANAIRLQGAHHPSPDGKAYMDFNSALQELRLAEENDQTERINQCHELINKIVTECIEREKLMRYLKSGVDSIKDEDINDLTKLCGKSGNVQKVIDAAQRRAFVTDELPFFCFTLFYTVTGGCSPLIKQAFSPTNAAIIDFCANAAAGAMAGATTGISQNYLRSWIQQSTLQNLSSAIKGAQLALAGAQRDAWNEKHINLKKLLEVLRLERGKLQKPLEQDSEGDRLEKINELIRDLKIKTKDAEKKWKQARSIHHQHDSSYRRIITAVLASGKSYMGEVSNKDQPGLLEGIPAQATMCAKLIAAPISLVANCGYIALGIPALLNLVSDTVINGLSTNSTDLGGIGNATHAYPNDPTGVINYGAVALSAAVGLPLIAGYVMRYQLLHPTIQYWIRPLFGTANIETKSANNGQKDTVVDMKKFLESRGDDSSSEVEESVANVDPQSSPNSLREIKKLNELVKQAKGSSYRNIDGRASDDSATDDIVEPSESSSSTV